MMRMDVVHSRLCGQQGPWVTLQLQQQRRRPLQDGRPCPQHSSRIREAQNSPAMAVFGTAPSQHPDATPPRPTSRVKSGWGVAGVRHVHTPRSSQIQQRKWGATATTAPAENFPAQQGTTRVTPLLHVARALHRRRGTSPQGSRGHTQNHRNPVEADIQRETRNNPRTGARPIAVKRTVNKNKSTWSNTRSNTHKSRSEQAHCHTVCRTSTPCQ